jgi:hypothetical protein
LLVLCWRAPRSRPKFVAMNAQRRRWGNRILFACRLMELEATPGIEPGYTVLQIEPPFGAPLAKSSG